MICSINCCWVSLFYTLVLSLKIAYHIIINVHYCTFAGNLVSCDMIVWFLSVYCRFVIVPLANALGVYERKQRQLAPCAPLESAFKKYKGRVPHTEIEVSYRGKVGHHLSANFHFFGQ